MSDDRVARLEARVAELEAKLAASSEPAPPRWDPCCNCGGSLYWCRRSGCPYS